ncbi:MAG TPA: MoaD/ThiS family protein [Acidothermaceae bacterium]
MFPSGFGDVNAGNRGVSDPPTGLIRYWAAAREAAGCSEEPYVAETLEQALAAATAAHGADLARVLARCAFVVDGTPVSRRDPATVRLAAGGTIEVLPPFAGGAGPALGDRVAARQPSEVLSRWGATMRG